MDQITESPELNKVQPANGAMPSVSNGTSPVTSLGEFPTDADRGRLNGYDYYNKLFMGQHFEAFNVKIDNESYNKAYSKLRYVMVNFAGLISKICADMLFSEPVTPKATDGDQEFINKLWSANKMDTQLYESELSNSALGDAVLKVRVGKRNPGDKNSTVIIEDITPSIYFPNIDGFNVRATPSSVELAWTFKKGDKTYLRKEIHYSGYIENKVFEMEGTKIMNEVGIEILGIEGLARVVLTGIDRLMVIHIPNWKMGNRWSGISDYNDIDNLFYAVNNRMTKIDNILDKHGDPILALPPGILDEQGKVKKKDLRVIEIGPDAEGGKPEYIVWDAKLESAFSEIEKLVDFMYLIGEISPDILGLGEGKSDSGKALKYKLLRTIAKVARKKIYYDQAIKEALYVAQLLAQKWSLQVDGVGITKAPVVPELVWRDGIPTDEAELIDNETKKVDAGLTSKKSAIMKIEDVDEEAAEKELSEIEEEKPVIEMPVSNLGGDNKDKNMDKTMDKNMNNGKPVK